MRLFLLCLLAVSAAAAPRVDKVEPPNWWVGHTHNPVQLLLTGSELKGASVSAVSKGFKVEVRSASANGHYLFLYLDIAKNVPAGSYRFHVGSGEFTFRLDRPLESKGRFQGFSGDDVIYLLMPDRSEEHTSELQS